jgi:hypothetical protein
MFGVLDKLSVRGEVGTARGKGVDGMLLGFAGVLAPSIDGEE